MSWVSTRIPEAVRNFVALAMLAAVLYTAYGQYEQRKYNEAYTLHTQNRTIESDVYLFITKAESAQRGYVLTGDDDFLKEYYSSNEQLRVRVRTLKIFLPKGNTGVLHDMSDSLDRKIREMDERIEEVRSKRVKVGLGNLTAGELEMRHIEDDLTTLIAQERNDIRYLAAAHP